MPMQPWMRTAGGLAALAVVLALAGCDKEPAKESNKQETPAATSAASTSTIIASSVQKPAAAAPRCAAGWPPRLDAWAPRHIIRRA